MRALAVLVRAPSRLAREPEALHRGVQRLAQALHAQGRLDADALQRVTQEMPRPARHVADARAAHFVREVERRAGEVRAPSVRSSLDRRLQTLAETYLGERLKDLSREGARQGAVLIVELPHNRVRAWAVGDAAHPDMIGVDAVRAARQPGSTLKPLLYAMALERGWSADTRIDDAALAEQVNGGLHQYRNYSRTHYGSVSVREALGNSLNIPAVRALQFVGGADFLQRLRRLGMHSLDAHPNVYGDGLALGNGEISLYELVQAYTALAGDGRWQPLTVFEDEREPRQVQTLFVPAAAHAVADVLSDPAARTLEFGAGGVLRFPLATAVKTGTSSDYRDAWTIAYDRRYVVGVWIGNLSGQETQGVTGARGPALLTRSLLAALAPEAQPLSIAAREEAAAPAPATEPVADPTPRLEQPFNGLRLAMDPRIPDALEAFEFRVRWVGAPREVRWWVDGAPAGSSTSLAWSWPLARGIHRAYAEIVDEEGVRWRTDEVSFQVQ
jgi:penicillin-binding protein 1C